MAFFEQLGKRISDAGQSVAQQTKNLADVTQLNSAISTKEKKIAQLYQAIGQLYYEAHKADDTTEYRDTLSEINALYTSITEDREKIKQIKGIVKCPNCGADVPLSAAFCNNCGTKMEPATETATETAEAARLCPNCHSVVSEGNAFCNHCGAKLDETTETDETNE